MSLTQKKKNGLGGVVLFGFGFLLCCLSSCAERSPSSFSRHSFVLLAEGKKKTTRQIRHTCTAMINVRVDYDIGSESERKILQREPCHNYILIIGSIILIRLMNQYRKQMEVLYSTVKLDT